MLEGFQSYCAWFVLVILAVYFLLGAPKPLNSRCCCNTPFFGAALEFNAVFPVLNDYMSKNTNRFKKNWCGAMPMVAPFNHFVCLCDAASVQHVLKDNFANYVKGKNFQDFMHEFLGSGVFATDGAEWKLHRKVASHMFSRNLLREGTKIATVQGAHMMPALEKACNSGEPVDLQDLFFRFTLDVFATIAFGVDLNSQVSLSLEQFLAKSHDFPFDSNSNLGRGSATPVCNRLRQRSVADRPALQGIADLGCEEGVVVGFVLMLVLVV
jgi:cytochrome P450